MNSKIKDPYKIVINYDPDAMWWPTFVARNKQDADAQEAKALLEEIVDEHVNAGVDTLVHCVFEGFRTLMLSCETADPYNVGDHPIVQGQAAHIPILAKLDAAGTDFIEVVLGRCRQRKMQFLGGLRMNDRHGGSGQNHLLWPRVQRMIDEHPEWRLEEFRGGLDYKYEGVRDGVLAFIEEFLGKYDVDGLEFDWMRWCHVFKTSEAVENAPLVTDFVRKARKLLDDAAAKRGRDRLTLGARIPQSIDECTNLGYDVAVWVKEGLVDFICPSDFYHTDFNCRVEDFVTLTEGTACEIYPSIHPKVAWRNRRIMSVEEYRAAAKSFYAYGARGVSPYNYQHHWDGGLLCPEGKPADMWPEAMSFLTDLKSAEMIAKGNRHYLYHPLWSEHAEGHCPTLAYKNDRIILDRSADDAQGTFSFRLAEDLTDEKLCATLGFKISQVAKGDELEIRLNGQAIPAQKIQAEWHIGRLPSGEDRLVPYFHFRISLSSPLIKCGDNELGVRLTNRVGLAKRMLNVQEMELKVEAQ